MALVHPHYEIHLESLSLSSLPSTKHFDKQQNSSTESLRVPLSTDLSSSSLTTERATALGMNVTETLAHEFVSSAKNGDMERIKSLLAHATPGCFIDTTDSRGWSALHWAAATGNAPLVELLCSRGASLKLETESGKTALDLALLINNDDVIDALLDHLPTVKGEDDEGCGNGSDMEVTSGNTGVKASGKINAGGPDRRQRARRHSCTSVERSRKNSTGMHTPPLSTNGSLGSLEMLTEAKIFEEDMLSSLQEVSGIDSSCEKWIKKEPAAVNVAKDDPDRKCSECGCMKTPQWRRGPNGPGTLCNSCGLKFIHLHNRDKKNARRREVYMLQKMVKEAQAVRQTQAAMGLTPPPIVPFVVDAASAQALRTSLAG